MIIKNRGLISFREKTKVELEAQKLRLLVGQSRRFYISKRIFDIVTSFLVIVLVLSWLIPILTIAIKLESRGSVFFVQRRVGRGGKIFLCIKLRTMVPNAEANIQQAVENDYRITKVGRFLRRTNLDEFPQFINVLLGQMSIVGPRPHMLADCVQFTLQIPEYKVRNIVKPGITGLAQVKGYRGPTKDFKSVLRRFQYDAFYIRHGNVWLDLRIIRQTAHQTIASLLHIVKKTRIREEKEMQDYAKAAA
jgi:putative colanic acid biosysnthesis UDP-glucose lipid carrier transferase